jgi:hypothetical protein
MTSHDTSDQQIDLYIKSVPVDLTHAEVDVSICCDDEAAKMNVTEEKRENIEEFINCRRPYDDGDDDYFLADISDNYDINNVTNNNRNNKCNYKIKNKSNYNSGNNNKIKCNYNSGHSKNENNNSTKKKEKITFFSMVYSLFQLKHGVKMI